MSKVERTWSLKEIDETRGVAKGTAYRAFKQLKEGFDEGSDYYVLSSAEDGPEILGLCDKGRLYARSINAVLLTERGFVAVMEFLDD